MSRINVISIYASIFFLENQTSSMLKHSNPAHHCSTAQTKIMGPLLSKLHNLQYYVHILPKWVSSKTNFPLLNMLTLQMKFSFLHNVSPPKLTLSVFLKFCYNPPLNLSPLYANIMNKPNGLDCSLKFYHKALHNWSSFSAQCCNEQSLFIPDYDSRSCSM